MRCFFAIIMISISCILFSNRFSNKVEMNNYIIKLLPKIHGWCSKEKAAAMVDLILEEKPNVCVEIGVFGGSSILPTALALKYNNSGKVWAIDPWAADECLIGMNREIHRDWWSSFNFEDIYLGFCNLITKEGLNKYCSVVRATSKQALELTPKTIDIIHIDGNHSEESAYFDATQYIPRVRSGGYIWFDDVHWKKYPDQQFNTKKALEYSLQFCELVKVVDNGNCVLLKKK
jgi:predicted O-methyltransferase YrrM